MGGLMEDRCVCCGEIIPEGQMACPNCLVYTVEATKANEEFLVIGGGKGSGKVFFLEQMIAFLRVQLKETREELERWKSAALFYREKAAGTGKENE